MKVNGGQEEEEMGNGAHTQQEGRWDLEAA